MDSSYNRYFEEVLHSAFSTSASKAMVLYDEISTVFLSADISTQTPMFYVLVEQLQHLEDQIGKPNQKNTLMKKIADVCEYQCSNK